MLIRQEQEEEHQQVQQQKLQREEEKEQQEEEQEQQEQQQQHILQMGSKRNRILTRQPRVKRDSDSLSSHVSPEPRSTTPTHITDVSILRGGSGDFEAIELQASAEAHVGSSSGMVNVNQTRTLFVNTRGHHRQHHLLTVPPRIERHSSEPAPSISPSSPNLLAVPQNSPFLIKQHSDPLPPTHHQYATTSHLTNINNVRSFDIGINDGVGRRLFSGAGINAGTLTNPFTPLHRQYSHPLASATAAATYAATSAPLQSTQHITLPEAIYANTSPPPVGSTQYIVPVQAIRSTHISGDIATTTSGTSINSLTTITTTTMATMATTTKIPSVTVSEEYSVSSSITNTITSGTNTTNSSSSINLKTNNNLKYRFTRSLPAATHTSLSSSSSSSTTTTTSGIQTSSGSSSFEFTPLLRVRNEELQRSVSSPQTSREMIILENPRSSHCPVIRPGPALGCNYCWNTIDSHGRILRRKTKYHCPECQTNLCIVPCFQEYHERLNNNETTPRTNNATKPSSSSPSSTSMHFGNNQTDNRTTRQQYTKTESI